MKRFILALAAIIGIGMVASHANYSATQGSGTTFGSIVVSTVHYAQTMLCDLTTPSQCAAVSAGGAVKVDNSGVTQPISGTVAVTQGTAANLNATVIGTGTFATQLTGSLPAGTASIGVIGADPSKGGATPASVKIDTASAATTQLVALSGSTKIYVTSYLLMAAGTTNFKFVYGTGTNCGTGTTDLTGALPLTAQAGAANGAGVGAMLVVPAGNALCVTNSAAIQVSGAVSYQQL